MTEYVTQNIRTVLKTFQNSAPKSLQGPGHSLQAASGPLDASHAGGGGGGDHTQSAVGNTHTLSPCSANAGGDHCHLSGSAAAPPTVPPPVALIKKEIFSSPEPFELNENASITIVPPPPPELPQPILSAADSGSGELYETRLEGKTIGCYSLGGEMRLCLPQFLNNVLGDFTLDQINRIFDELGIFCSQCTPDQLMEFKAAKILPSDVKACGLITRTDAERLCAALLHRADRNIYINDADIPKGAISFKVYHRCFGKCEGICTPDMYSYTKPTCIMCLECKGYFSPQKFVGHVHRKQENRTCHWGFDSRNWHEYLHVALDVENRDKYQKILDELKEVEFKEAMKAQRDMSYLKRKAEMFLDDAMLGPPLGQPAILPPHQQLAANCGGKQRELLDIPSKKLKNLDETSAYQLSEYQRYQALFYAQCMQQQRIGQMSAFRPWAPPKSFLQVPYNTVAANLPYLSQEPPVLQNPERVVRNTDRERFERTYQPNVALAPRKSILTKEREKEQREREREQRERERLEREQRERELLRVRERERERSLEREREREREQRERELQKQKLQQQQQQQQQHVAITNLCEAELVHIKQERANTPVEVPPSPPLAEDELLLERRSNGAIEDETTMPMMSPLSLSRSQQQHHHLQQQQQQHQQHQQKSNNIEMLQRRHSLHTSNSTSSTSSTSSTLSTHSLAGVCNEHEQLLLSSTSPQQQLPAHLPPPNHHHHHHRLQQQQQQLLPLPQPHQHQQQLRPQHQQTPPSPPTLSPEEFSGSNEISSSTSPLPPIQPNQQQHLHQQQQTGGTSSSNNNNNNNNNINLHQQQQQQHQTQTIIATVNQHAKLLPNSSCASAIMTANSNCNNINNNNNNELPSRIRISKNLINQPNIMRSPTPPSSNQQQQQHHHHQHSQQQQQHQQLLQHQQHYEQYKQQQRFYQQQQQHQQQTQRHQNPQQQQPQQQSPSQSSAANNMSSNCLSQEARAAAGLNLSSNGAAGVVVSKQQQHQLMQQQHLQQQQQQQNGGTHMGSEFELSTDTDDDSLNGEPDSSNMLAPWELAVEALKDTRPKDRERILQLLQKLLQDNQQYRFDNLQLSEELRKRDKQICDLQEQLYRCHQQQHQVAANQNGDSSSVIAKNDESIEGMLRLPLKKSTRRDPVAAAEAISVVVMKRNQQIQSCNGLNCTQEEHERNARRDQAEESDSEMDEDEEEKCAKSVEQREAAVKREREHHNISDNEEEDDDETEQQSTSDKKRHCDDVSIEARTLHSQQQQQQQQNPDEDDDEEDDNNSRMSETDSDDANETVKAPHTSAVATPPTATTPISPDSAATAGRLFDSSNSSDDESMKQAQMSASNALAKMTVDRQEAENDEDENDDDEEEDEDVDEHDNNDDEDGERDEMVGRQTLGAETSSRTTITTTTTTTNHEIKIKQELI